MKRSFTFLLALFTVLSLSAQEEIYLEGFESGLPSGWTADETWAAGDAASLSSQFFGIPDHGNFMAVNDDALGQGVSGDGMMVSGEIDLSEYTDPFLSYEGFFFDGDYGADETAKVLVSTDGGATWTEVYDMAGNVEAWQSITVDLAEYAGMTIQLAFEYKDGGGWNYGYAVDDVRIFQPLALDGELAVITTTRRYDFAPFTSDLEGTIVNQGINTITSFDLNWTDGTDTYTDNVSGVEIPAFGTYNFSHSTGVEVATNDVVRDIEVWISNVNGGEDLNPDNDMAAALFSGLTFEAEQAVIGEEATGTWCGWCPRGHVFMEELTEEHEDFIGIAVHGGSVNEPMYVANYNDGFTPLISGYPSGVVNRVHIDVDPSEFETYYNQEKAKPAPVGLEVYSSLEETTRELTITLDATFAAALRGDHRFSVIITENGVTGTGDGTNTNNLDYDQVNYYAGNANGPMGGYEALPDPVPATDMVYDLVARALLTDWNGMEGSLPTDIAQDETHSMEFTYTIPEEYNYENIQVVGLVIDANSGAVLNAARSDINEVVGINDINLYEGNVSVAPNPFQGQTNIRVELAEASDVNIVVFNAVGQQVAHRDYGQLTGDVILPFNAVNMEAGVYFIHLNINDQIVTKKVVLSK